MIFRMPRNILPIVDLILVIECLHKSYPFYHITKGSLVFPELTKDSLINFHFKATTSVEGFIAWLVEFQGNSPSEVVLYKRGHI